MKNYLIIHGHFYQPPREDPWTGLIPRQHSAEPFENWNIKINRECYAANSASRVLNSKGNITNIVNNYRYLSFNFGPTLLNWLKKEANGVYQRILDADKYSQDNNNGHGNAIAQGYNHTILPLDSKEVMRTQIRWGIDDFVSHFKREPEGFWLPETAVNSDVIDELIACKIKYTVLSPWQADSVCTPGSKTWRSLYGHPAPSHKAYRIERPSGNLNIFFYDPTLASGLSFNHFLQDADKLKQTIDGYFHDQENGHLISIATDGEVYGHHEPFGDMCLAAFIEKANGRYEICNYGQYLELFPPVELVKLKSGEDDAGSSWSCSHGVSRWFKNCGCSTGGEEGWNQNWRTPLRKAFSYLRNETEKTFIREMAKFSDKNGFEIRNSYIHVLAGETEKKEYLGNEFPSADDEQKLLITRLLEGQKYMMYMFTSCGWFFSELSGIEPVQNMKYALRLVELYSPWFNGSVLEKLLVDLSEAESNIPSKGTGRTIMENEVIPSAKNDAYGASILILQSFLNPGQKKQYGCYRLVNLKEQKFEDITEYSSECSIINCETGKAMDFKFSISKTESMEIKIDLEDNENKYAVLASELPECIRSRISREFVQNLEKECIAQYSHQFEKLKTALSVVEKLATEPSNLIKKTAEVIISQLMMQTLQDKTKLLKQEEIVFLREMIELKKKHNLEIDEKKITVMLSEILAYQTDFFSENPTAATTSYIQKLCDLAWSGGFELEKTIPQNIVFSLINEYGEEYFRQISNQDFEAFSNLRNLINLGESLGIEVEEMKARLLKP